MRRLIALALALGTMGFIACAQGTSDGPPDHPDAHIGSQFPDAPSSSSPDAFQDPPDAFVPPTSDANVSAPDAAGSGSGTGSAGSVCTSTADCDTSQGLCCLLIAGPPGLCVPGTEPIPGVCLPN